VQGGKQFDRIFHAVFSGRMRTPRGVFQGLEFAFLITRPTGIGRSDGCRISLLGGGRRFGAGLEAFMGLLMS